MLGFSSFREKQMRISANRMAYPARAWCKLAHGACSPSVSITPLAPLARDQAGCLYCPETGLSCTYAAALLIWAVFGHGENCQRLHSQTIATPSAILMLGTGVSLRRPIYHGLPEVIQAPEFASDCMMDDVAYRHASGCLQAWRQIPSLDGKCAVDRCCILS